MPSATTYGLGPDNDLILAVDELGPAGSRGTVRERTSGRTTSVSLQVDGEHNLLDATAALIVGELVGVDPEAGAGSLATFAGVHRRFEHRGSARGAEFFDDYGHTPTEMEVTVATARRRDPRRLIALVQPHRYTRVQALWRELGAQRGRRRPRAGHRRVRRGPGTDPRASPASSSSTGCSSPIPSTPVVYLPHRRDVVDYLDREVRTGDLVVTMGCGDVWMLGDAAIERIEGSGR